MLFQREKTYTFHEFLDLMENKNKSIFQNKLEVYLEDMARKINLDDDLKRKTVIVLGSVLNYQQVALAGTSQAVANINKAGKQITDVLGSFGYWICIIFCAIEIIRSLMQGSTKGVYKILMKYIVGFASIHFLPWIFDIAQSAFEVTR